MNKRHGLIGLALLACVSTCCALGGIGAIGLAYIPRTPDTPEGAWCLLGHNARGDELYHVMRFNPNGTASLIIEPRGGRRIRMSGRWDRDATTWILTARLLTTQTQRGTFDFRGDEISLIQRDGVEFAHFNRADCDYVLSQVR